MTSRLRKEVQIFKEVYQHSRFGDHVEEVRPAAPLLMTPPLILSACTMSSAERGDTSTTQRNLEQWSNMHCAWAAQVRFEQPICLTGIKVGAAPSTAGPLGGPPFVHVFAADLTTLSAARFSLLTQHCTLPATGTKAVRLEVCVIGPFRSSVPFFFSS
jgi:hypothetical protein